MGKNSRRKQTGSHTASSGIEPDAVTSTPPTGDGDQCEYWERRNPVFTAAKNDLKNWGETMEGAVWRWINEVTPSSLPRRVGAERRRSDAHSPGLKIEIGENNDRSDGPPFCNDGTNCSTNELQRHHAVGRNRTGYLFVMSEVTPVSLPRKGACKASSEALSFDDMLEMNRGERQSEPIPL